MNFKNNKKLILISLTISFIILFIFVMGMIILKYNVEGEKELPFEVSKIVIISSSEGIENTNSENKWDKNVDQNNTIYIYLSKNKNFKKTEIIDCIKLDNFKIEKNSNKGIVKIYKPSNDGNELFYNNEKNEVNNEIKYIGDLESNIKELKISNQGGLIVFRISYCNIGRYISNENDSIDNTDLIRYIDISNDDLKINASFDLLISLVNNKKYKANIKIDLPIGDIKNNRLEELTIEGKELNNIVFKRIEK